MFKASAQDKRRHFSIPTLSRPIQSHDCIAEMKTGVEDELEVNGVKFREAETTVISTTEERDFRGMCLNEARRHR